MQETERIENNEQEIDNNTEYFDKVVDQIIAEEVVIQKNK